MIRKAVMVFVLCGCLVLGAFTALAAGTGSIEGQSLGILPGSYVEGTTLKLYDSGGNLVAERTSDMSGSFSFTGLAPGNYTLKSESIGNYRTEKSIKVENGKKSNGDIFVVKNNGGSNQGAIAGYLYNGVTGQPISGATVASWLPGSDNSVTKITNSNGYFVTEGLSAGIYEFFIDDPDTYYGQFKNVNIPATGGCVKWTNVYTGQKVAGKGGIFGEVNDQLGYPVPGAQVTISGSGGTYTVTTDDNGMYGVNNVTPASGYTITVSKSGYDVGTTPGVVVQGGYASNWFPTVTKQSNGNAISGTVTDAASGDPLSGANVTMNNGSTTGTATTGEDGKYSIQNLLPDKAWELSIAKEGYHTTKKSGVETKESETVVENQPLIQKTQGKGAIIAKVKSYPIGNPVKFQLVTLSNAAGQTVTSKSTDENGEFYMPGLEPGVYTIEVPHGSKQKVVVVDCNAVVTDLVQMEGTLIESGGFFGKITDTDTGKAVPGAEITVLGDNGESVTTTTDTNGEYVASGESTDKAKSMQISKPGYHTTEIEKVERKSGEVAVKKARLVPKQTGCGAIVGRIIEHPSGKPVAGVKVRVNHRYGPRQSGGYETAAEVTTDKDGNFTAPGLSPGDGNNYSLTIDGRDQGYYCVVGTDMFSVYDCHATFKEIRIRPSGTLVTENGGITGSIINTETGKEVDEVSLQAHKTHAGRPYGYSNTSAEKIAEEIYTATVDENGVYFFDNLPGGESYDITVSGNGILTSTITAVPVKAGEAAMKTVYTGDTGAAGTGAFGGRVTVWETGESLSGALVTITPGGLTATSDRFGLWTIADVPPASNYTVTVTAAGFDTNTSTYQTVTAGSITTVTTAMTSGVTVLPPTNVVVSDTGNDNGHQLKLTWTKSASDSIVTSYYIYRSRKAQFVEPAIPIGRLTTIEALKTAEADSTVLIAEVAGTVSSFTDPYVPLNGVPYYYWVQAVADNGSSEKIAASTGQTGIVEEPEPFRVSGFYPNPFNPTTTIQFDMSESAPVSLDIFDALGRKVTTLVDSRLSAGSHSFVWDGKDTSGSLTASGVYLYSLRIGAHTAKGKVMFLR